MDQLLAATAHLNNQAVDQLNREEYLEAVSNLTSALQIVKDLMAVISWESEEDHDLDVQEEQISSYRQSDVVFCAPQDGISCKRTDNEESHQDMAWEVADSHQALHKDVSSRQGTAAHRHQRHFMDRVDPTQEFVYNNPLQIWASALACRDLNSELLSELSVALMFNLALSHHLRASYESLHKDVQSRNLIFTQAVSLYELAYEVQMQEDVELSVECTMAIVNNLGHIHRRLGNAEKATKCFSHLLSTLLFVQSSVVCNETENQHISESSTEGFVRSISYLILRNQVAEAA